MDMSQLLKTKFHIPKPRASLVSRPRLIERLNAGASRKLTLLSAPPGFGKTTLLSEWIHQKAEGGRMKDEQRLPSSFILHPLPFAWLSLDETDNDPARFLAYFIAALQTLHANLGESTFEALRSRQLPSVESLLTTFINEMADLSQPFVYILDDYHVIVAEPVHAALTFLLDHLPTPMHLIIATRADPPLPLSRLRARDQLVELRATDLLFTIDEATAFLNQVMGLNLSARDVAALTERTEGWITGLQMAALSMQGRSDVSGFVRALTGSHRLVLDYLGEEVLNRQSSPTKDFLLKTSILDRLTAPLCDAVTEGSASQATLTRLEQGNLFLLALDDERRWYRYRRLFADLLQSRLALQYPDQIASLHRKASVWHEQNGQLPEAIHHALDARDFECAARLVNQCAEATLMRSEVVTFLSWTARVPDELLRARSSLWLFQTWALLMNGASSPTIEARLAEMGDTTETRGRIAALRAHIAGIQGDIARAGGFVRQALEQLPASDMLFRNLASWLQSALKVSQGDFVASIQSLRDLAEASQQNGNVMVAAAALSQLAEVHLRQGQLHQTQTLYARAIAIATDAQGRRLPIASRPLIGVGEVYREWNDFDAAISCLLEGIELSKQWRAAIGVGGYVTLARIRQAQGDIAAANDAIEQAWQLAVQDRATEFDDIAVMLYRAHSASTNISSSRAG